MPLPSSTEILVWVLVATCLLLSGVAVFLAIRVGRLARLGGPGSAPGEVARMASLARDVKTVSEQMGRVESGLAALRGLVQTCIQHVGVVRYDAFRDMGGHMSFSLALLDSRQNGVVLSVLNGRDGSRGYAKPVQGGRSSSPLSNEEQEALSQALDLARTR